MMDRNQLLACVPVGKDNALPCRAIWKNLGMWSDHSVMRWLKILCGDGVARMQLRPYGNDQFQWVFWRETE